MLVLKYTQKSYTYCIFEHYLTLRNSMAILSILDMLLKYTDRYCIAGNLKGKFWLTCQFESGHKFTKLKATKEH